MLVVHDLTGPAGAPLLFDIDLCVARGETVLVIGPIQSGKSMLMRHIVGLERAERGTVTIDGGCFDAADAHEAELRQLRTRVGVMFEGSALLRRISVLANVELPLLEHGRAGSREARDVARELLVEVGVSVEDHLMPMQLDRASQRRVALARALALRPPLLLLDEPTTGLDAVAAHAFDDTLYALQRRDGFGLLLFSHEVRHAYGPADEIDVLADGRIVARGTRDALLGSDEPVVHQLLHRRGRE
ncbi:MAG TPA: ATP-binding cassette domain-containing protein [Gemmatimonadaceae bacterium]|nr:ATP-binding cassette domain-containing protein [Gemmatimonadaceae bacterium]